MLQPLSLEAAGWGGGGGGERLLYIAVLVQPHEGGGVHAKNKNIQMISYGVIHYISFSMVREFHTAA